MNIKNINKLIAHLKAQTQIGFNMREFVTLAAPGFEDKSGHNCGTVACLAGHIFMIEKPDIPQSEYPTIHSCRFVVVGQEFLGITYQQAQKLFMYWDGPTRRVAPEEITPPDAIRCLETFRDTGIIDWDEAYESR